MSNEKFSDGLNFNIDSIDERLELVRGILEENDDKLVEYYDEHYNPHINQTGFLSESSKMSKDLEALTNYILYSKDSDITDEIVTDYRQKRNNAREASIDTLMKVRDFKKETNKSIMKVPKIKVNKKDREKHIELKQSGEVIENLTRQIKTGKDSKGNELSQTEIRKLKWIRTDIQKDEVAVKNELKRYIRFQSITKPEPDMTALSFLRFDDPEIVRILIEDYSELKENSYEDTYGYMKIILFAFEELIEKTDLKDYMKDILVWKIEGMPYDYMIDQLASKYDLKITKPRLSKLTRETIPNLIVDAYKQQKEDWLYTYIMKGDYKQCTSCKRNFLSTTKYFSPNKKSKLGLRSICKECRKRK